MDPYAHTVGERWKKGPSKRKRDNKKICGGGGGVQSFFTFEGRDARIVSGLDTKRKAAANTMKPTCIQPIRTHTHTHTHTNIPGGVRWCVMVPVHAITGGMKDTTHGVAHRGREPLHPRTISVPTPM